MKEYYTDWDSLFERFCIMTVDGGLSDFMAVNILYSKTKPELIKKLREFCNKKESKVWNKFSN